jgi:GntR family transcriptional regulator / MocR family aminotransferase
MGEMAKGSSALTPVIAVDRGNSQPLHSQIYRSLRNAIATGVLRPGQRLPSSRALSAELDVSRITILEAYSQLLAEGYFKSRKGAGTFVSSSLPEYLTQVRNAVNGRAQRASGPRLVAKRALQFPAEPATYGWRDERYG